MLPNTFFGLLESGFTDFVYELRVVTSTAY